MYCFYVTLQEKIIGASVEQRAKECRDYSSVGEGNAVIFGDLVYRNEKKVNFAERLHFLTNYVNNICRTHNISCLNRR